MRKRQSVCVHEPPCCFSFCDPGSDSTTDLRQQQKAYHRKRRTPVYNAFPAPTKPYKRKEPLPHIHPCVQSPRQYSRLSYDRNVPPFCSKSPRQNLNYEDSSTDVRSISGLSQSTTSTLTVDVSKEIAAVNKAIEELVVRFEKSVSEGGRGSGRKKRLGPEQIRLLSMERPPLERLSEIPMQYLKPRPPAQFDSGKSKPTRQCPLSSPAKTSMIQNRGLKSESSELLKTMFQDMKLHGFISKNDEVGKNLKKIHANMAFEDSSEIKIDLNGLAAAARTTLPKENQSVSGMAGSEFISSVSTQTPVDTEFSLTKMSPSEEAPKNGEGDADKSQASFKRNTSKTVDSRSIQPITRELSRSSITKMLHSEDVNIYKRAPIVVPPEHKQISIYTAQTPSMSKLKNMNKWEFYDKIEKTKLSDLLDRAGVADDKCELQYKSPLGVSVTEAGADIKNLPRILDEFSPDRTKEYQRENDHRNGYTKERKDSREGSSSKTEIPSTLQKNDFSSKLQSVGLDNGLGTTRPTRENQSTDNQRPSEVSKREDFKEYLSQPGTHDGKNSTDRLPSFARINCNNPVEVESQKAENTSNGRKKNSCASPTRSPSRKEEHTKNYTQSESSIGNICNTIVENAYKLSHTTKTKSTDPTTFGVTKKENREKP